MTWTYAKTGLYILYFIAAGLTALILILSFQMTGLLLCIPMMGVALTVYNLRALRQQADPSRLDQLERQMAELARMHKATLLALQNSPRIGER